MYLPSSVSPTEVEQSQVDPLGLLQTYPGGAGGRNVLAAPRPRYIAGMQLHADIADQVRIALRECERMLPISRRIV